MRAGGAYSICLLYTSRLCLNDRYPLGRLLLPERYRLARYRTRAELTVAIAHEIMKQLGEELSVSSNPGEGSAFMFTLHFAPQSAQRLDKVQEDSRLLDEAELKVVQLTKGADGAPQETELADAGI